MAPDMTSMSIPAQLPAFAFDPADSAVGTASFLDDDTQFFQQLASALPDADQTGAHALSTEPPTTPIASVDVHPTQVTSKNRTKAPAPLAEKRCLGFAAGAIVQTDKGQKCVQDIRPGDRVLTRDHGFRPIVWVGQRSVSLAEQMAEPALCPVLIARGALGPNMPDQPVKLSSDQGLMVEGPLTKLLFGTKEVLVPASHLVGYPGIEQAPLAPVEYFYLMCATHEVIWADSIWTESFQAGDPAKLKLDAAQRRALETVFAVHDIPAAGQSAARRTLLRHEADLLMA